MDDREKKLLARVRAGNGGFVINGSEELTERVRDALLEQSWPDHRQERCPSDAERGCADALETLRAGWNVAEPLPEHTRFRFLKKLLCRAMMVVTRYQALFNRAILQAVEQLSSLFPLLQRAQRRLDRQQALLSATQAELDALREETQRQAELARGQQRELEALQGELAILREQSRRQAAELDARTAQLSGRTEELSDHTRQALEQLTQQTRRTEEGLAEQRADVGMLRGWLDETMGSFNYRLLQNGEGIRYLHREQNETSAYLLERLRTGAPAPQAAPAPDAAALPPIVYITDEGYAETTATSLVSLLCSRDPATRYRVIVVGRRLTPETARRLRALDPCVELIEGTDKADRFQDDGRRYVTATALTKFELPALLPEYDRALYLDGDVIVLRDLSELLRAELEGAYAAAVRDVYLTQRAPEKVRGFDLNTYFNSGVLLLDLEKMRRDRIPERLWSSDEAGSTFMDQSAFNQVLAGHVRLLPPTYNFLTTYYRQFTAGELAELFALPERELEETRRRPHILHYAGSEKPWRCWDADRFVWYEDHRLTRADRFAVANAEEQPAGRTI